MEEPIQFSVLGCLLAVGDLETVRLLVPSAPNLKGNGQRERTYSITRLLSEKLSKSDHICVIVELLGKVDHLVCRVLLVTNASTSEKRRSSCDGNGVALLATTSCVLKYHDLSTFVFTKAKGEKNVHKRPPRQSLNRQ